MVAGGDPPKVFGQARPCGMVAGGDPLKLFGQARPCGMVAGGAVSGDTSYVRLTAAAIGLV